MLVVIIVLIISYLRNMEPMALGSPPASPNSPVTNPNFLPAFLMGENTSTPRTNSISPAKNRPTAFKPNIPLDNRSQIQQSRYYGQVQDSSFNLSGVSEKVGPPAKGLFDNFEVKAFEVRNEICTPVRENKQCDVVDYATPQKNFARNLNESLNKSYRKVIDNSDSLWITVLGFPPHAASLVLSQFAQCGTIIDKRFPPEGNWVNLKYCSQHDVARALSFNGKLISNSIMVGVIQLNNCENKENSAENLNITSPNRARPLTQQYLPKQNPAEVLSPQNVPQKSTGLVSKAMEYVFGW